MYIHHSPAENEMCCHMLLSKIHHDSKSTILALLSFDRGDWRHGGDLRLRTGPQGPQGAQMAPGGPGQRKASW